MKMIVTGGTGFLGRPLCQAWADEGHEVVLLTRSLPPGTSRHDSGSGVPGITQAGWVPDGHAGPWASLVEGADVAVNLAGESIGARRWTAAQKERIRSSRILATRSLVSAITAATRPPSVLISGSAMGYYGSRGSEILTEESTPGSDFLAGVCVEWEQEATRAAGPTTRVATIRTSLVLDRDGGALEKMMPPFRRFVGGPMGSGRQYMSWIHRLDWVDMVRWIARTPEASGPFNASAPAPVTNRQFSKALGRAMGRPSLLPAPAFALRLLLGEMADGLLLSSQRMLPAHAQALGYRFGLSDVGQALRLILEEKG